MKPHSHCLIGNIFEPPLVVLDPAREYSVGRDSTADVFLPARQVSRRHAKISWSAEDQGFVIRDQWSRRGFVVNGKPTERRLLRDDDEITIEPYRLRYRVYEGDVGVLLARDPGEPPPGFSLSGRARGAELLDLIGHVDLAGLSVTIDVESDAVSGKLVISAGQILDADAGYLKGGRAAHALLMGDGCRFSMRTTAAPPAPGPNAIPITQVLSEILARMGTDFVTTIDSAGIQESEVLQLEKRLRAAGTEKQLRALAKKGRMLEDDVARAEELSRAMQRPLPRDSRVTFESLVRPAAAIAAGVHAVTHLSANLFRVLLAEPAATGLEGLLRAIVIKTEYDLADSADLRGADVLSLLHRRLGQRAAKIEFTASTLDLVLERGEGLSVSHSGDGAVQLLHCHDGVAQPPPRGTPMVGAMPTLTPEPAMRVELADGRELTTVHLQAARGDRLLIVAGAVSRQHDPTGQILGLPRLAAIATRTARRPLRAALEGIVAEVDSFRGSAPQEGDFILVGIDV